MDVSKSQHGTVTLLALSGPMVSDSLGPIELQISECIEADQLRVVLEMEGVPFIDSAGLEKIQDLVSDVSKRGGDVRVTGLNQACRDIFLATRMERLIYVMDSRDDAIRSLA
jgi:anti-sigma B factor antagonist